MIKKEINEIKSQYTLEECGILRLCGCYVNGDKEKVARFNQTFLNLPEEEKHKYFDILERHCREHRARIFWICVLPWIPMQTAAREPFISAARQRN